MTRTRLAALALLTTCALVGCVDRRIHITSEPTGAEVTLNDVNVGRTPLEVDFTYFGVYEVRLRKPGFQTLVTTAEAKAPLHEQPGIDFIAMLIPGRESTLIEWDFTLDPIDPDPDRLIGRADELREELDAQPEP